MHVFMTYIWYNMLMAIKANRQLACIVWRLDLGKLSGLTQGEKNTERKREGKMGYCCSWDWGQGLGNGNRTQKISISSCFIDTTSSNIDHSLRKSRYFRKGKETVCIRLKLLLDKKCSLFCFLNLWVVTGKVCFMMVFGTICSLLKFEIGFW